MQNTICAVKADCALHNFVRQQDGFQFEDSLQHTMERAQWTGVHGTRQGAHVRDMYASYFMSPVGQVLWQLEAID